MASVQYGIDEQLKKDFEDVCKSMGLKPSALFQLFAKAVVRERKIPFEIKADTNQEETKGDL